MDANLTYYIREGVLVGLIGGRMFHLSAYSGGGGGSTAHESTSSTNNPYMEGLKTKGKSNAVGHVHGGPIPPGTYSVKKPLIHRHLGRAAELVHPHWRPMGRDAFFIHRNGPHGSDGCIVPTDYAKFTQLMDALERSNGGDLVVQETSDGTRFA